MRARRLYRMFPPSSAVSGKFSCGRGGGRGKLSCGMSPNFTRAVKFLVPRVFLKGEFGASCAHARGCCIPPRAWDSSEVPGTPAVVAPAAAVDAYRSRRALESWRTATPLSLELGYFRARAHCDFTPPKVYSCSGLARKSSQPPPRWQRQRPRQRVAMAARHP